MARRILPLAVVGILILAACGASTASDADPPSAGPPDDTAATDDEAGEPLVLDSIDSSPRNVTASGLEIHRDRSNPEGVPAPLVDFDEVRSGGPPPDGIPPIDEPRFLPVTDVDFLADNEPVLALDIDGDARAYPVQIMTWHEIVNDTLGDVPVAVSYCPLCNSAVAFDRRCSTRRS